MTGHRARLADALRAVSVTETSYAWFGRPSRPLPPDLAAAVGPDAARASLVGALERELYRSFYTQGRAVPETPDRPAPVRPDRDFAAALSAANAGAGGWEPGWRVQTWEAETAIVALDGIAVRARTADCRTDGRAPAPGAPVERSPPEGARRGLAGLLQKKKKKKKKKKNTHTHNNIALGDRRPGAGEEVRVYFHLTAAGAAPLVAACTSVLNAAAVPFVLKVVDRPGGFTRCDAAVLYLQRGGFGGALADRSRAWRRHVPVTCARACRRSRRRWPRASPSPSTGRSTARASARAAAGPVAEAVVRARELGAVGLDERLETVARRFADHGLDIDRPYLAAGSAARYAL